MPRITLNGWYEYDNNILNGISVPESVNITVTTAQGDVTKTIAGIDKENLVNLIRYKLGDLYTYIQEPVALQVMVHKWFITRYRDYERVLQSLYSEYNPLDNVFEYERFDKVDNFKDENTRTGKSTQTNTGGSSTENQTSAYDSGTYQPDSKQLFNYTGNGIKSETEFDQLKDTMQRTSLDQHDVHYRHGNIGVTSSQQMITQELELRKKSLYDEIIKEFEENFIVRVY